MNQEEILNAVKTLAKSQGSYGRLYQFLTNGTEDAENALDTMERQNFQSVFDLVMWVEC